MSTHNRMILGLITVGITASMAAVAADQAPDYTGMAVRNDTSPPMRELIRIHEDKVQAGLLNVVEPDYLIPNILDVPEREDFERLMERPSQNRGASGSNGFPTEQVLLSVEGYNQDDNIAVVGGQPAPPDTNGDVGIDFYIQYVNLGWLVLNKSDGSRAAGPFAGNTFWAGFGGPCETNNSGDPIVLFDKQAGRWMFSQFTSPNNPDGRQCYAVSTTADPLGPYHRYEFVYEGVFNDYPHIGVWDDESGARSGYYIVTHDFSDVGGPNQAFEQASYAVVERDRMLNGEPAQFVRFTDTAVAGLSGFGAQPAHLESIQVAPAGTCNPFVQGRPDQNGYQFRDLCVDWDNTANSTLAPAVLADAGESWTPGPGSVSQPGTTNTLDTLANTGRILYRASYRAYPDQPDRGNQLENTMVISFPVNVGNGQAGVRWAQINFNAAPPGPGGNDIFSDGFETVIPANPEVTLEVVNQGEYAPDTADRWMSGISIDQAGNIGMAYTTADADNNIFPGVRFTTRRHEDPVNTMRDEAICVDGGGIQTGGGGRWGDYSSVSVDPTNECTFWASVEYVRTTADRDWANRVCAFEVPGCSGPAVLFDAAVQTDVSVCAADTDQAVFDFGLQAFSGFADTVTVSLANEPAGTTVNFPDGLVYNTYPVSSTFEINGLTGSPSGEFDLVLSGTSSINVPDFGYRLSVSSDATDVAANLNSPADLSTGVELLPTFSWSAVPDALAYQLEVATDAGFTNLVIDEMVTDLSFAATQSLDLDSNYFWRVTGLNNCGAGVVSAVFEFTTGNFVTGTAAECPPGDQANVVFFDDVEGDISDWTIESVTNTNAWTQSTVRAFSGTSFFVEDVSTTSQQRLTSPAITLPDASQAPISLSYWNFQNMEANEGTGGSACWDGGILEISTDGGNTFTPIAGSNLLVDPYNGGFTPGGGNPLDPGTGWCADDAVGASGEQLDFPVVLLDSFAGQTVQFRFTLGTDGFVGDEGWYLDNITVQGCQLE